MKILASSNSTRILIICVCTTFIFMPGCIPIFSEMQSARTVGKNKVEIAPHYTQSTMLNEEDGSYVQEHIALQLAYGLDERVDIRGRFEVTDNVNIIALGPKIRIDNKERLAVNLPVGTTIDSGDRLWQFQPSLLYTQPVVKDQVEFTIAPKAIIPFCAGCNTIFATNMNLAIGKNIRKLAFRPEYGIAFDNDGNDHAGQFSIGISATFGGNGKKSGASSNN